MLIKVIKASTDSKFGDLSTEFQNRSAIVVRSVGKAVPFFFSDFFGADHHTHFWTEWHADHLIIISYILLVRDRKALLLSKALIDVPHHVHILYML